MIHLDVLLKVQMKVVMKMDMRVTAAIQEDSQCTQIL